MTGLAPGKFLCHGCPHRVKDNHFKGGTMNRLPNIKHSQKVIFRGKSNKFLFICKAVHQMFWFAVGTIGGVLLPTLFLSGIAGHFCNDGKLNQPILSLGICLIPIIITCRITYIIWLRKRQFYTITIESITHEGGLFRTFNQKIWIVDIRSISCHSSLIQQILGCGNIIINTAATRQGTLVLKNVDNANNLYKTIENFRQKRS